MKTSATWFSGTCPPVGVSMVNVRIALMSCRTFGTPHTTTSKIFCSSYISPTLAPLIRVVAALYRDELALGTEVKTTGIDGLVSFEFTGLEYCDYVVVTLSRRGADKDEHGPYYYHCTGTEDWDLGFGTDPPCDDLYVYDEELCCDNWYIVGEIINCRYDP